MKRWCNACTWAGKETDCVWLGAIGPLCPECHETTDTALPAERNCCGTFYGSPHRSTCANYRGKFKPANAKVTGSPALSASPCGLPGSAAGNSEKG